MAHKYDSAVAIDIATAAVSVISSLGIGTVMGQWVAGGKERREVRARALAALAEVESARWANLSESPEAFTSAVRDLQTAMLVARLPREPTRAYIALATVGRWKSVESFERNPDAEHGGGINSKLADTVRDAAQLMSDVIWTPGLWRRMWLSRRLSRLNRTVDELDKPILTRLDMARKFIH